MNNDTKLSKKEAQEAKKTARENKKAEKLAAKNASKNNTKTSKKPSKFTKTKAKNSTKIEHDKSELAKKLNIRISNPYGYYPEDVDPIILQLQKDVSSLTKENKELSDKLYTAEKNLKDLSIEFQQFKLNASLVEIKEPSIEESLINLSKIDNITGNQHDNQIPALANLLDDNVEENNNFIESQQPIKPKIKLKFGGKS